PGPAGEGPVPLPMDASGPGHGGAACGGVGRRRRRGRPARGRGHHVRSRVGAGRPGRGRRAPIVPSASRGPEAGATAHRAVVLLSRAHRGPVGPEPDLGYSIHLRGAAMSADLKTKVQELIETMINPAVAGHGGFVELIDVQDNRVYLQMGGGCQGCGAADVTLKAGIERLIKEELPEVAEVLDTTDHAAGANPYYTPGKA